MKIADFLRSVRMDRNLIQVDDAFTAQDTLRKRRLEAAKVSSRGYSPTEDEDDEIPWSIPKARNKDVPSEFQSAIQAGFLFPIFRKVVLGALRLSRGLGLGFARFAFRRILFPVAATVLKTVARGIAGLAVRLVAFTPIGLGVALTLGSIAALALIWRKFHKGTPIEEPIQTAKEFKQDKGIVQRERQKDTTVPIESRPKVREEVKEIKPRAKPEAPRTRIEDLKKPVEPSVISPSQRRISGMREAIRRARETSKGATNLPAIFAEVQQKTGIDANILAAILYRESSFRPEAFNKGTKATGLAQFLASTWAGLDKPIWRKRFANYGMDRSRMTRTNPRDSAMAVAIWWKYEVIPALTRLIGHSPNPVDIYLGHFMGPSGGSSLINKAASSPNTIASQTLPKGTTEKKALSMIGQIPESRRLNLSIFYIIENGIIIRPRTYKEIYDYFASEILSSYHAYDIVKNDTKSIDDVEVKVLPASTPPAKKPSSKPLSKATSKGSPQEVAWAPTEYIKVGGAIYAFS